MKPRKTFKILGLVLEISVALVSMGIAYAGGVKG